MQTSARRVIVNLDGSWEVEESLSADEWPTSYGHRAPVPGLLHLAEPPFPQVGEFESRELQYNRRILQPLYASDYQGPSVDEEAFAHYAGVSRQPRNYFWYRRIFRAPALRQHAFVEVAKAQFGSTVWLNGIEVGNRDSCYTAGQYDVSSALKWGEDNELIIRIGAHPAVLPEGNTCVTDFEKYEWMPGIWDSVELQCFDGPRIKDVQVAPQIAPRQILVETLIENLSAKPAEVHLAHLVKDRSGASTMGSHDEQLTLAPSERRTHRCIIALPDSDLWSPASPTLYDLTTTLDGDDITTRFGLREFRFETATKRAYLNGQQIFLRGLGICLHRFFEDPLCSDLPWNEKWVRSLIQDSAAKLNLNAMKVCIGPVPRKWMNIFDETGILVFNEFPMWTLSAEMFGGYLKEFDRAVLAQEMRDWVRENRNHSSVILWSTGLESHTPWLAEEILPEVRATDLSNRAWSDSLNPPTERDDPYEDHPYEFAGSAVPGRPQFDMVQLEGRGGFERPNLRAAPSGHACIIAEYGWLWLNRDGSPTILTGQVYPVLPYPTDTPEERIATAGYLLGGLTEYWRSYRHHAGVSFYGLLAGSRPDGFTSDYFRDIQKLELQPAFEEHVSEAFKPLGVYLNFWQRELKVGVEHQFIVMLCNDEADEQVGELALSLVGENGTTTLATRPFDMGAFGQHTLMIRVRLPDTAGSYTLMATASTETGTTTSKRWLQLKDGPLTPVATTGEGPAGQQL